jgi:hypothetical protein
VLEWVADWEMCGHCDKVCEKWMRPIITKVLINTRWRLNQLIDNKGSKPADVDVEHWKTLVAMRATEAAHMRSEHMRSISKGKGSTTAQMKAIERQVVSRLVRVELCLCWLRIVGFNQIYVKMTGRVLSNVNVDDRCLL